MAEGKPDYERGRIETIKLKSSIMFNRNVITTAVIELDHINYGLNRATRSLNKTRRTNFSIRDIERFLMRLDGEDLVAIGHTGRISHFAIRVDCPVLGKFYGKEFLMIFDTDYDKPEQIYTLTIYPGWKK